jgi:hypothetical protein
MKASELWDQLQHVPPELGDLDIRCTDRSRGAEQFWPNIIEIVTLDGTDVTFLSLECQ